MPPTKYGTVEFYVTQFSHLLADIQSDDPTTTENIIQGFYQALDSWFEYHDEQARTYADIRKRVRQALTV